MPDETTKAFATTSYTLGLTDEYERARFGAPRVRHSFFNNISTDTQSGQATAGRR